MLPLQHSGALAPIRFAVVLSLLAMHTHAIAQPPPATALEKYVYTPDPAYGFELDDTIAGAGYTAYILLMDSLRWRTSEQVNRTLWTHQIIVVVPDVVTSDTALLIINGGSNPQEPPDGTLLSIAAAIATLSGSVLAAVSQIPNQPLVFPDQPQALAEDALVAYSWDKAMDTGDPGWAAYLPMTKASVRALDAVEDFVNNAVPDRQIDDFVVTGFSKRGATAWLVAAVDPRVRAVAPGVFDVLNIPVQIERHYQAYGFYAPAIDDYVNFDIVRRVRSPEGRFLERIVDPLSYRATLDLPKLLLNATGDQFFLPDAANFYAPKLPGETLIRQVPNTDHGFTNGLLPALDSLLAWYATTLSESPRPAIRWTRTGELVNVTSQPPATTASLWQATNNDTRDFRLESLGAAWTETVLAPSADGRYTLSLPAPVAGGYTGYLLVLGFADGSATQTYSTPVFVTPETLPFALVDPIINPRQVPYWQCQVLSPPHGCVQPADYTPAQLEAFMPVSVFGEYVSDLAALTALFAHVPDRHARARQACMATRLNIAAGALGWYSQVTEARAVRPLWQAYADAESAYASGQVRRAAHQCNALNRL